MFPQNVLLLEHMAIHSINMRQGEIGPRLLQNEARRIGKDFGQKANDHYLEVASNIQLLIALASLKIGPICILLCILQLRILYCVIEKLDILFVCNSFKSNFNLLDILANQTFQLERLLFQKMLLIAKIWHFMQIQSAEYILNSSLFSFKPIRNQAACINIQFLSGRLVIYSSYFRQLYQYLML